MNPDQTPIRHDSQNSEEETLYTASSTLPPPASILRSQPVPDYPPETSSYQPARPDSDHPSIAASMSQYSSSSADDSVYSMPGPQSYQLVTPYDDRSMSQDNKDQLIAALRANRYNTVTDLRRVERIFAYLDDEEVTEPMTRAWRHYVDSHNFLSELRTLTRNYPFSSECLDEAKILVQQDPESIRSWNYCWLILVKIQNDRLIQRHARSTAVNPQMWRDHNPTANQVDLLYKNLVAEWTRAVKQMLRLWDQPPSTTGH